MTPFIFSNVDSNSVYIKRNALAPLFYGIMLIFSTAILIIYILFFKQKNIWVMLSILAVFVINIGYFALSVSSSVSEALLANKISYFGNVFLILFNLLTLSNACGIKYKKMLVVFLFSISVIMFIFVSTQGYLDIFYKNVDFAIVDGYLKLIKEYGFTHTLYIVYMLSYFTILVCTVIYAIKKKNVSSKKIIYAIFFMGFSGLSVWFFEQFAENKIEYLSLCYVIDEIILLWIYKKMIKDGMIDTYIITMKFLDNEETEKTVNILVGNSTNAETLTTEPHGNFIVDFSKFSDSQLRYVISQIKSESGLTERETDVALLLLKNLKRKEIASEMFLSEETVKSHISHIYKKLQVSGKNDFLQKTVRSMEICEFEKI